jgi:hypothetical protein
MLEEGSSSSIPSIWTSFNNWFTPTVLFVLLNVMIGTILFSSSLAHPPQEHKEENQEDHNHNQNRAKLGRSPSVLQRLRSINFNSYRSQEPQQSATRLKQTLDFDNHRQQHLQPETHYLFEQTHHEKALFEQNHLGKNQENPHLFEQSHLGKTQEKETPSYLFEQNHSEKAQEAEALYFFERQKVQETETQFVFQQGQETGDQYFDEQDEEEDGEPQSLEEVYSQLTERHHSNRTARTTSDTKPASGELPAKLPAKMRKSASMKSPFGHFEEGNIVETESRRPATVRERRTKATEGDHEVDAKADDFINKFKNQLKLQRLDSIMRYKEVINRGASGK